MQKSKEIQSSAPSVGEYSFLYILSIGVTFALFSLIFLIDDQTPILTVMQLFWGSFTNNLLLAYLFFLLIYLVRFLGNRVFVIVQIVLFNMALLFMTIDYIIFNQFKFHINSFVIKVVLQPNIFETLNIGWREYVTAIVVLAGGLLIAILNWKLLSSQKLTAIHTLVHGPWRKIACGVMIFLLALGDKTLFAWQLFQGNTEIYLTAKRVPLYIIAQMGRQFESMGFEKPENALALAEKKSERIKYPLESFDLPPKQANYPNLIFLMSEKMRHDIINPDVTPRIMSYVEDSFTKYRQHYSISNGTAQGLFGLFYSLPSSYMDSFSKAKVSPMFLDVLQARGYDLALFAKADLGFFGSDETIFNKVRDQVRDRFASEAAMIDSAMSVLDQRKQRSSNPPLFLMVFHDAPHDPQFSHPEFKRYLPDDYMPIFNPANAEDRERASNQFKNAYTMVDFEMGRLLDRLKEDGYFDNSLIMITGDHGHEQYEKGYWGHASAFTKEQTKVSFFLHLPQQEEYGEVERLTSHLDVVPTLLEVMREELPLEQFSIGQSLLHPPQRDYIIIDGLANRVLFDGRIKIDYTPFEGLAVYRVTDAEDNPLSNSNEILQQYTPKIFGMFDQLGRFYF